MGGPYIYLTSPFSPPFWKTSPSLVSFLSQKSVWCENADGENADGEKTDVEKVDWVKRPTAEKAD